MGSSRKHKKVYNGTMKPINPRIVDFYCCVSVSVRCRRRTAFLNGEVDLPTKEIFRFKNSHRLLKILKHNILVHQFIT